MVGPVDKVVGREHMVAVHAVAALRWLEVVARVDVETSVGPYMTGGIGGIHRADAVGAVHRRWKFNEKRIFISIVIGYLISLPACEATAMQPKAIVIIVFFIADIR